MSFTGDSSGSVDVDIEEAEREALSGTEYRSLNDLVEDLYLVEKTLEDEDIRRVNEVFAHASYAIVSDDVENHLQQMYESLQDISEDELRSTYQRFAENVEYQIRDST